MNIDEMPAGREMDALVAEKVMGSPRHSWGSIGGEGVLYEWDGCTVCRQSRERYDNGKKSRPYEDETCMLPYSTDIAAAFELLEKAIMKVGRGFELWGSNHYPDIYGVNFRFDGLDIVFADTVPLAICRAALKATI